MPVPAPRGAARVATSAPDALAACYLDVRARTVLLAAPLSPEDAQIQSMADASPAKWHLAHTTWFFERFVLGARDGYVPVHAQWDYLFNSYYNSVGPMHARPHRGMVTRPTLAEVLDYRAEVDARMQLRFEAGEIDDELAEVVLLGTHHEQQHQELLLTDIKHAFWSNPLGPAYRDDLPARAGSESPLRWIACDETIVEIGASPWPASTEFAYDNESPQHRVLVPAHALASRPVSNGEYAEFVADGGYRNAALWLSEAWGLLQHEAIERPLYWHADGAREFTLGGWRARDPHAPVCHLSYYEADAFARWAAARLPTEAEWEAAAAGMPVQGNFADNGLHHPQGCHSEQREESAFSDSVSEDQQQIPRVARNHKLDTSEAGSGLQQMFGDVWEWTSSAYTAYPGFTPLPGSLGEYNGKFMCGQWVLRGGSCATSRDHVRASYRNFFPPPTRWQFSGLRLAKNIA